MNQKKLLLSYYQNSYSILKLWRIIILSVEGKIIFFETLAIFELAHLALLTNEIAKTQKIFIWHDSFSKIKHERLRKELKAGRPKIY